MESKTYTKNQLMSINKFGFLGLNNHILFKCNLLKHPRSFQIKSLMTNDSVNIDIQDYEENVNEENVNEENVNEENVNEENVNEENVVLNLHSDSESESENESYYNMKSINLKDENYKSIGIQCDIEEMYDYIEWVFL
jgi:hypothetical protein